jgi:hypothetical protein
MNIFLSNWTLVIAGLVFALPMIYIRVRDHTEYADETLSVLTLSQSVRIDSSWLYSARMDDSGNIRAISPRIPNINQSIEGV